MEKYKPNKSSEWTFEKVKKYLEENPDKNEHIVELRSIPESERIERWVGLLKTGSSKSSDKEFVGFAIFTLGLRDPQLDELLARAEAQGN